MMLINPSSCNLYFFIRKLDKSLSTSLLIRIKSILMIDIHKKCDEILDRTRTSFCKQICKQRDFLAYGADLIDRRENNGRNGIMVEIPLCS